MIHSVLSAAETDNDDANPNNIIFTNKDITSYYSIKYQNLSKLLSKRFERLVYRNEYKTKSESKNATKEYRCFLKSNLVGVN